MKSWNYNIPSDKHGEGWAHIVIHENGMFATVSDYGNYVHQWTRSGCEDIRSFFLNAEREWQYFARKFCPERVVNHAASFKAARTFLLQERRAGNYTKDQARQVWSELGCYSDWEEYLNSDDNTDFVDEPWNLTVREENEQVRMFTQKVMPKLVELLKEDLAKNARRCVIGVDILTSRGFCIDPEVRNKLGAALGPKVPHRSIFYESWPTKHCDFHDGKLFPRHIPWSGTKTRDIETLVMTLRAFEGSAEIVVRWDNGEFTGLQLNNHSVIYARRVRLVLD